MAQSTGNGESATFEVYLIDIDSISDSVREEGCTTTGAYSPGFLDKYYRLIAGYSCNHALDIY